MKHKKAFTLAEVLITLTIVGVIAALTIPTLMSRYEQKVLEAKFNQAYSLITNASKMMQIDYPNIYTDLSTAIVEKGMSAAYAEHLDKLINYISKSKMCETYYLYCQGTAAKKYKNFSNTAYAHIDADSLTNKSIITDSGIMIFMSPWGNSGYHIDTNGPAKGPNRLGWDLFSFQYNSDNTIGAYSRGEYVFGCMKNTSNNAYQGFLCAKWALLNKCETDPAKTYWECLK